MLPHNENRRQSQSMETNNPIIGSPVAADEQTGPSQTHKPTTTLVAKTSNLISRKDRTTETGSLYFYKNAQWSADGTTLITSNSLNEISSFVLPTDLLEPNSSPKELSPLGTVRLPEPILSYKPAPYFALEYPGTHLALAACAEQPIKLYSLFQPPAEEMPSSSIRGTYRFINHSTEAYLPATSMIWPVARSFLAGSKNCLALFDVSQTSSGPVTTIPTIPSARHKLKGGGVGMKGMVSALSCEQQQNFQGGQGGYDGIIGLVAAGTRTRQVGIYDLARSMTATSLFGVAEAAGSVARIGGSGVMQTAWSPCGRYLLICERQSTGMLVYDVRVEGRLLGWLRGKATSESQQVLACDIFAGSDNAGGFEVWAGDHDGVVRVWEGVGMQEGELQPKWDWQAHEKGVGVGSSVLHNTGSVVATCSGSWVPYEGNYDDRQPGVYSQEDCCLKVWSVAFGGSLSDDNQEALEAHGLPVSEPAEEPGP